MDLAESVVEILKEGADIITESPPQPRTTETQG